MAQVISSLAPTPEQRAVAAKQYERANQVIAAGDHDYGIRLLMDCCKLDPANLIYRKALRGTEKVKFKNNLKGSRFSVVATAPLKLKLKKARLAGKHVRVLEICEEILTHNPWDVSTQQAMAGTFDELELPQLAVWTLEQARQKSPRDLKLNRQLARLYEKIGSFTHASILWTVIRHDDPTDEEAQRKAKDLAASETISRGNYGSVLGSESAMANEENAGHPRAIPQENSGEITPVPAPQELKDRSKREFEELQARIEKEPHVVHNYLQLSQFHRRREQWDEAREVLQSGLQATGNQFELAIEFAEIEIQPFRQNLAVTEARLQENAGEKKLEKLRTKLTKEIHTRELDVFRQKADRYPTDMSYRMEMGVRLLQLGQIDEAIEQLQMARTDPRVHWKALSFLGMCFKARNNWRLAQRNFEDALRQLPSSETTRRKEILYQLATGCAKAGEMNAAVEWAYELANEDFSYKNIGTLLDEWQRKTGKA